MEDQVKELIRKSLRQRISGLPRIDNVYQNEDLVGHWLTAIMSLGYNGNDVEKASIDINEIQSQIMDVCSMEDTRAFVFLAQNRFYEEIFAFMKYVELRDSESPEVIMYAVTEELRYIDEGDFMLS